jgi:F0F1-type ATP synthase epsilon subunit
MSVLQNDNAIHLTVMSREYVIYDGMVGAITSMNDTGEFDILPFHQNFISLIKQKLVFSPLTGDPTQVAMDYGILHVNRNRVRVFLGIGK